MFDVKKPRRLCLPTAIDGAPAPTERLQLTCYPTKPAKGQPKFAKRQGMKVRTPFSDVVLDVLAPTDLCFPSLMAPNIR